MSTIVTAAGLAQDVRDFLSFKRAMGLGYRRAEFTLDGFVRFVMNILRISANVTADFGIVTGLRVDAGLRAFDCRDGVVFVG
jgi:hypothetical protein